MKPNIEKYKKEASKRGLVFIGKSSGKSKQRKYRYKFLDCSHFIDAVPNNLRRSNSKLKCNDCLIAKYKKEALNRGLIYLGSANDGTFNLYKVKRCESILKIQPTNIRRSNEEYNCRCNKCIPIKIEKAKKNNVRYRVSKPKINKEEQKKRKNKRLLKYKTEATQKGLIFLGYSKTKTKHYRRYKFIECGHTTDIQMSVVRHANPYCHVCKEEEFKVDALKAGLKLIGKSTRHKRKYKFISCGHVQSIGVKEVREKSFKCQICHENEFKEDAKKVGLALVGAGKNSLYRTYKFNDCKHTQEIIAGHVRLNNFICNTCNETSRDKPSKIYLLKMSYKNHEWLKLGYAKVLSNRIRQYGLAEGVITELLFEVSYKKGRDAHTHEAKLHKKYIDKKLNKIEMKKYLTKSGNNECYPMEIKEMLREELANLGNK